MMRRRSLVVLLLVAATAMSVVPVAGAATSDTESEGQAIELTAFVDIGGSVFENAINWLAEQGITLGCNPPNNTLFCPRDNVTRGEMAVFLSRAFGLPAPAGNYFDDDNGKFYESAANRMFEAGLTVGCGADRYCGDNDIGRDEMAAFLARALGLPPSNVDRFVDDTGSIFEDAINKIAAVDITLGCNPPDNNRYCPDQAVTRGEMSAFIKRALSAKAVCAGVTEISAGQCSALIAIYEATNGSGWINSSGWLLGNPCTWFGVTCAGGSVTGFNMPANNLTGAIPTALASLPDLATLNLDDNVLSGSIPAQLGTLGNLTLLDLSSNALTGSIPAQLGSLTSLTILDLDKNQLSGAIPTALGNMTSLVELRAFENSLTGSIPSDLGDLANLDFLDLSLNSLSGSIPPELWDATGLIDIDLSDNNLNDVIPDVASLAVLTELDLSFNLLDGPIPDSLATRPLLEELDLSNNQLADPDVPDFDLLGPTLVQLLLFNNGCMDTNPLDQPLEDYIALRDSLWNNGCP